ncbi:DMT family transporter [bacterium]|nr:DMT family transporter [bacterium]
MTTSSKKGIITLIIATFFLALMDGMSRYMAELYDVLNINMFRFWVIGSFVILVSLRGPGVLLSILKTKQPIAQIFRGLLFISSLLMAIYSYTQVGLIVTHALMAVFPLLTVLLSGLFLEEEITRTKIVAVSVGFLGVTIIINPTNMELSLVSALPLIAAVNFAIYAVLTRKVASTDNTETSFFWVSLVSAIAITIPSPLFYQPIQLSDLYFLILLCTFSLVGHFLLTNAYRHAEASVLQPFSYFHLFFASIVGIIFFQDPLTISTVAGSGLIVFGGILISRNSKM